MHVSSGLSAQHQLRPPCSSCNPPAWAHALATSARHSEERDGFSITLSSGPHASLLRLTLPAAAALDAADLEHRTVDAYAHLRRSLASLPHPHPVRFWNFIPGINQPMDAERDRYMVFNAGRYAAFEGWFGSAGKFASHLPAASAVGHDGDALVIHCLSMRQPGEAVENPRQIPAFGYSARYGPRPPCFSRATIVNATDGPDAATSLLIVSGTASILGERTVHPANLDAQLAELLDNLQAVLSAAGASSESNSPAPPLQAFESVRVYHPHPSDAATIAKAAGAAFGPRASLELVRADLCRADLLVEVEGVARLDRLRPQERTA